MIFSIFSNVCKELKTVIMFWRNMILTLSPEVSKKLKYWCDLFKGSDIIILIYNLLYCRRIILSTCGIRPN